MQYSCSEHFRQVVDKEKKKHKEKPADQHADTPSLPRLRFLLRGRRRQLQLTLTRSSGLYRTLLRNRGV